MSNIEVMEQTKRNSVGAIADDGLSILTAYRQAKLEKLSKLWVIQDRYTIPAPGPLSLDNFAFVFDHRIPIEGNEQLR